MFGIGINTRLHAPSVLWVDCIDKSSLVVWLHLDLYFSSVFVCQLSLGAKVGLIFYAIILPRCPFKSKLELYSIC